MKTETCLKSKRDIVFTRAGGFIRARYAGRSVCVLAPDRHLAISRLRAFDKHEAVTPTAFQRLLAEVEAGVA